MTFKRLAIASALAILALYGGLILSLFYFFKVSLLCKNLISERILFSIRLSLTTATLATIISLTLAVPAAYAISRFDFYGKKAADTVLELPLVLSPAAFGAMLLIFFNVPLGQWIQESLFRFVFQVRGIVLAQVVTSIGIATRLIRAAMDEIPRRYEDVARSLGASPLKAFLTVTLPLLKRGIMASGILTWAKTLGEFGATITLAGAMPLKTETLPVAIYTRLSVADIDSTIVLILISIFIGLGILYGVRVALKSTTSYV